MKRRTMARIGAMTVTALAVTGAASAQMIYTPGFAVSASASYQCQEDGAGNILTNQTFWDDPSDLLSLSTPTTFSFSESANPADFTNILSSSINATLTAQASPTRFEVFYNVSRAFELAPETDAGLVAINNNFNVEVDVTIGFDEDTTVRLSFDNQGSATYDNIFVSITGVDGFPVAGFIYDLNFSDITVPYSVELDVPTGSSLSVYLSENARLSDNQLSGSETSLSVQSTTSFVVEVITSCAADFNGVNDVTVQDIFDFLTAWLAGASSADFNGTNGVTVQDIFDFLTAWLAGC